MKTERQLFEYKFVTLQYRRGWWAARPQGVDHRAVIAEHAREGWRLIQLIEPGSSGWVLLGSQMLGELIFERAVGAGAEVAEPNSVL